MHQCGYDYLVHSSYRYREKSCSSLVEVIDHAIGQCDIYEDGTRAMSLCRDGKLYVDALCTSDAGRSETMRELVPSCTTDFYNNSYDCGHEADTSPSIADSPFPIPSGAGAQHFQEASMAQRSLITYLCIWILLTCVRS